MKAPWEEEEKECPSCGDLMENVAQWEWVCATCGDYLNTEPDWDEMKGGKDYD